jgi:hypothetical protein
MDAGRLLFLQHCNSGAPSSGITSGKGERNNLWQAPENSVNTLPQSAAAFTVNDADLKDTVLPANSYKVREEVFHIAGLERVQVQYAVNG